MQMSSEPARPIGASGCLRAEELSPAAWRLQVGRGTGTQAPCQLPGVFLCLSDSSLL